MRKKRILWERGTKPKGKSNCLCACGCGQFTTYNRNSGLANKWIRGHFDSEDWRRHISESLKGREISEWQKERIRVSNRNRVVSDITKTKMSKAAKKRTDPRGIYKRSKETIEKMRKAKLGKPWKNKGQKRPNLTGKNNGRYGIPPPASSSRGIRSKIIDPEGKTICVRSTWEAFIAKWLSSKGIFWTYEPKVFPLYAYDGRELTYTPDFFTDHFIEVKGWWTDIAREKVRLFREQYPNEVLEIIDEERFKEIKQSIN